MDIFQALGNNRFPRENISALYKSIWKKIERLATHEIMEALESHLDALDALNTPSIGEYALASGLAPDEYHFLNLRAGVIMQGRKCFERVLAVDYAPLEKLRGFGISLADYAKAAPLYRRMAENAESDQSLLQGRMGALRCAVALKQDSEIIAAGQLVMEETKATAEMKEEAALIKQGKEAAA